MSDLTAFRPMLAAKLESEVDYDKLVYPLVISPKIDGIRCAIHPQLGAVSRTLKPIPNSFIRRSLSIAALNYLDGEIVTYNDDGKIDDFNTVQSKVMSADGSPNFLYYVFDHFGSANLKCPYSLRFRDVDAAINDAVDRYYTINGYVISLCKDYTGSLVHNRDELVYHTSEIIECGYEGVCLRDPRSPYKFGRATLKQQNLIKIKPLEDAEARVIGYVPMYRNNNQPTFDAFGLQKRSSHNAGYEEDPERIGTLVCRGVTGTFKGVVFEVGTGFSDDQRISWRTRLAPQVIRGKDENDVYMLDESLEPIYITHQYQKYGAKDRPRGSSFKGERFGTDFLEE